MTDRAPVASSRPRGFRWSANMANAVALPVISVGAAAGGRVPWSVVVPAFAAAGLLAGLLRTVRLTLYDDATLKWQSFAAGAEAEEVTLGAGARASAAAGGPTVRIVGSCGRDMTIDARAWDPGLLASVGGLVEADEAAGGLLGRAARRRAGASGVR